MDTYDLHFKRITRFYFSSELLVKYSSAWNGVIYFQVRDMIGEIKMSAYLDYFNLLLSWSILRLVITYSLKSMVDCDIITDIIQFSNLFQKLFLRQTFSTSFSFLY